MSQSNTPAKANAGQISQQPHKVRFSVAIKQKSFQDLIMDAVGGDPHRAALFTSSITSAVSSNPDLQECAPATILSAALLGNALKLSPSPQLGQYYMVPFKKKNKQGEVVAINATFILGYKGYIQLALRSGMYKRLNVMEVRKGEYLGKDKETGEPRFEFIEDDDIREALPVIGYMASFTYVNGFQKSLYWSREKMLNHASKYSQTFSRSEYERFISGKVPKSEEWKFTGQSASQWYKDFDGMAMKTMIRQILSKWGQLSPDMEMAAIHDNNVIGMDGDMFYNDETYGTAEVEPEPELVDAEVVETVQGPDGQESLNINEL